MQSKAYINEPCYSMTGRLEPRSSAPGAPRSWVAYLTSRDKLFRVEPGSNAVTVIRRAEPGTLFRGVALPPNGVPSPTATPSRGPSASATATDTPAATSSRSKKPRFR